MENGGDWGDEERAELEEDGKHGGAVRAALVLDEERSWGRDGGGGLLNFQSPTLAVFGRAWKMMITWHH